MGAQNIRNVEVLDKPNAGIEIEDKRPRRLGGRWSLVGAPQTFYRSDTFHPSARRFGKGCRCVKSG